MTGIETAPTVHLTPTGSVRKPTQATIIAVSALIGVLIAVLWSARLVDDDIGVHVANGMLGHDADSAGLSGTLTGLVFAFVTGVAGTFTACNVAVFSAVASMVEDENSMRQRLRRAVGPLGWLIFGAAVVAGGYGALGAQLGTRIPQLSVKTVGNNLPVRILQSITVFTVIGLAMIYLGLASLSVVPDPLRRATARWAPTPQLVMGVLIGGFLIGRPWPMFHKTFAHAASTHNAAFGAATFVLVVAGNMLLMGALYLVLSVTGFSRWQRANSVRSMGVTASALLIGGVFTVCYWGIRVPAKFGYGWFPSMPWS
jgi:hypothetical protein